MKFIFLCVMLVFAIDGPYGDCCDGPAYVNLKADNGKYLSRIYYPDSGQNNIEAAKSAPDYFTKFIAKRCPDGKLTLQADNGKYLSRIHRASADFTEAAKSSPGVFSRFQVYPQPDGTVVLKADNGKYLSRIDRGGRNNIEAAKSRIDVYCKFKLQFQL